jgi:hypothetical protein
MSDRDELTRLMYANADVTNMLDAECAADVVWAAGWRKKPSREAVESHLEQMEFHWSEPWAGDVLDAILALLDGPTENGEK